MAFLHIFSMKRKGRSIEVLQGDEARAVRGGGRPSKTFLGKDAIRCQETGGSMPRCLDRLLEIEYSLDGRTTPHATSMFLSFSENGTTDFSVFSSVIVVVITESDPSIFRRLHTFALSFPNHSSGCVHTVSRGATSRTHRLPCNLPDPNPRSSGADRETSGT